jgi:hypothetical protein
LLYELHALTIKKKSIIPIIQRIAFAPELSLLPLLEGELLEGLGDTGLD